MDMNKKRVINATITAIVGLSISVMVGTTLAADKNANMEKCGGIVKAKMNDCGSPTHACAGQASKNNNPQDWVFLPKGTCNKIVGGVVLDKTGKEMKKDVKAENGASQYPGQPNGQEDKAS